MSVKSATFAATVLFGLYLVFIGSLSGLPFLDLPNHAARAFIIAHISTNTFFSNAFVFKPSFHPYILGDLVLSGIYQILPFTAGALLWIALCFALLPLSVLLYARKKRFAAEDQVILFCLSMYLATTWFFLSGYTAYLLGISFSLIVALLLENVLDAQSHKSLIARLICYTTGVTCLYLLHLAAAFMGAVWCIGIVCARLFAKTCSMSRAVLTGVPWLVLAVIHLTQDDDSTSHISKFEYGSVTEKFLGIGGAFLRFNSYQDCLLLLACTGLFIVLCRRTPRGPHEQNHAIPIPARPYAWACILFAVAFFILPSEIEINGEIDRRALPYIFITAFLFALQVARHEGRVPRFAAPLSLIIAACNLLYLWHYVPPYNRYLQIYHAALDEIPAGKTVLSVATIPDDGRVQMTFHAGLPYVVKHDGIMPDLFSEQTSGAQFSYFAYLHSLKYVPNIDWYLAGANLDWKGVQQTYDYIVVPKPFDDKRFSESVLTKTFENKAATVFQVKRIR